MHIYLESFFSSSSCHHFLYRSISIDLDIVAISTAEQKSDSGMENFSLEPSNVDNSTTTITNINNNNHLPSIENTNWYDGSMETFIHRTIPNQIEFSADIREIPNDEGLREIDINAVGDEFYLFSPRTTTTDDEPSSSINDDNEIIENSKRIFTMEEKTFNDPFDFDDNNNLSSLMITNLDDILIDDDDDNNINDSRLLNPNYRRPIQEDILYEVEHENSLSDHSQNTSAIIPTNDKVNLYSYLIINK